MWTCHNVVLIESTEEVKEILFQLERCPLFAVSYPRQEFCGSEICLRLVQKYILAQRFEFLWLQFARGSFKCPPPHQT